MEPQEFRSQLEQLQWVIIRGLAYFQVWRDLMVEDEASARGLDRYRGVFQPAREALREMALLDFAKVFDDDRKAVSFRNLLKEAKRDPQKLIPHRTDETLLAIEERLEANKAVLDSLKKARNKRLAHHDPIVPRDSSVTYGPFLRLTEDVKTMYNLLSAAHYKTATHFEPALREAHLHTYQLVKLLREQAEKH